MADIIEQYLALPEKERRMVGAACRAPQSGLSMLRLYFPGITPGDLRTLQSYIAHQNPLDMR